VELQFHNGWCKQDNDGQHAIPGNKLQKPPTIVDAPERRCFTGSHALIVCKVIHSLA
jgi:hypothetical protein